MRVYTYVRGSTYIINVVEGREGKGKEGKGKEGKGKEGKGKEGKVNQTTSVS